MGGKNTTTTQTSQNTTVPAWMSQNAWQISNNALAQPSTYETQNRNAAVNPGFDATQGHIDNAAGAFQPWQSRADTAVTTANNANQAGSISGPDFSADAINRFKNPYDRNVIDQTISDMNRSRQMAAMTDNSNAATAGAFGGARHGVANALTNEAYDRNTGRALGELNQAGYNSAIGQYNTDYGQRIAAQDQANRAAAQNYAQGADYSGRLAALGQQGVTNEQNAANAQFMLASKLQDVNQSAFDRNVDEYRYARTAPLDFMAKQQAINTGAAHDTSTTGTQTQTTPVDYLATALYGAGASMPYLMKSDERVKDNIEDLNPEGILGAFAAIPTKSYDYKPEHAGPYKGRRDGFMAQDYETAFGEKSPEVEGVKVIDIPQLAGRVVAAIKGLEARTRHLKKSAA